MTIEEFEAHVAATEKREDGTVGGLDYALLKLCAEAGEVAQIRGKEILADLWVGSDDEQRTRRARYALELGDVAWYVVEVARLLGLTFEQVLALNVMKLSRRRALQATGRPTGKGTHGEQRAAENHLRGPQPTLTMVEYDGYGKCTTCGDLTRHRDAIGSLRCVPCGGAP